MLSPLTRRPASARPRRSIDEMSLEEVQRELDFLALEVAEHSSHPATESTDSVVVPSRRRRQPVRSFGEVITHRMEWNSAVMIQRILRGHFVRARLRRIRWRFRKLATIAVSKAVEMVARDVGASGALVSVPEAAGVVVLRAETRAALRTERIADEVQTRLEALVGLQPVSSSDEDPEPEPEPFLRLPREGVHLPNGQRVTAKRIDEGAIDEEQIDGGFATLTELSSEDVLGPGYELLPHGAEFSGEPVEISFDLSAQLTQSTSTDNATAPPPSTVALATGPTNNGKQEAMLLILRKSAPGEPWLPLVQGESVSVDKAGIATVKLQSFSFFKSVVYKGPRAAARAAKGVANALGKATEDFVRKGVGSIADANPAVVSAIVKYGAMSAGAALSAATVSTGGLAALLIPTVGSKLKDVIENPGSLQKFAKQLNAQLQDPNNSLQGALKKSIKEIAIAKGVPKLKEVLDPLLADFGLEWSQLEGFVLELTVDEITEAMCHPETVLSKLIHDNVLALLRPLLEPLLADTSVLHDLGCTRPLSWDEVEQLLSTIDVAQQKEALKEPASLLRHLVVLFLENHQDSQSAEAEVSDANQTRTDTASAFAELQDSLEKQQEQWAAERAHLIANLKSFEQRVQEESKLAARAKKQAMVARQKELTTRLSTKLNVSAVDSLATLAAADGTSVEDLTSDDYKLEDIREMLRDDQLCGGRVRTKVRKGIEKEWMAAAKQSHGHGEDESGSAAGGESTDLLQDHRPAADGTSVEELTTEYRDLSQGPSPVDSSATLVAEVAAEKSTSDEYRLEDIGKMLDEDVSGQVLQISSMQARTLQLPGGWSIGDSVVSTVSHSARTGSITAGDVGAVLGPSSDTSSDHLETKVRVEFASVSLVSFNMHATALLVKADSSLGAFYRSGKLPGGLSVGDKVASTVSHLCSTGSIAPGDIGTVRGPCSNASLEEPQEKVRVEFEDFFINMFATTQIVKADSSLGAFYRSGKLPGGWSVGDKVASTVSPTLRTGSLSVGDIGTVQGPCSDASLGDPETKVLVAFASGSFDVVATSIVKADSSLGAFYRSGKLPGGLSVGDKVVSTVSHAGSTGSFAPGEVGTVHGPCSNASTSKAETRVLVEFESAKVWVNMFATSLVQADSNLAADPMLLADGVPIACQPGFGPWLNFSGEPKLCSPQTVDTALENASAVSGMCAVALRGDCSFTDMAKRAQDAGARCMVISMRHNQPAMERLSAESDQIAQIRIPVVSIVFADSSVVANADSLVLSFGDAKAGGGTYTCVERNGVAKRAEPSESASLSHGPEHGHIVHAERIVTGDNSWQYLKLVSGGYVPIKKDGPTLFELVHAAGSASMSGIYRFMKGAAAKYNGKVGIVLTNPDSDREVKVKWTDGETSGYIKATELAEASVSDQREAASRWCKVGVIAKHNDRLGRITKEPDSDADIKMRYENGEESKYLKAITVHPASSEEASSFGTSGNSLTEGAQVTVLTDTDKVRSLAAGHGGWCDGMSNYCGQTGAIQQIKSGGDVRVRFADGNSWLFNPKALVPGSGGGRLTKGDQVVAAPGMTEGPLGNGGVGVIIEDDHGNRPYKVRANGDTHWYKADQVRRAPGAGASTNDDGAKGKKSGPSIGNQTGATVPKLTNETIREAVRAFCDEGGGKKRADFLHSPNAAAKYGPVSAWDVSGVTDMSHLFDGMEAFNQPIGKWKVKQVKTMHRMFCHAEAFNQPIGEWEVDQVKNMAEMFEEAHAFNQPIGQWSVHNVTNMYHMFYKAKSFNQPIGKWRVDKVTNMRGMFAWARAFDQPIGEWQVGQVTDMSYMFCTAKAFNQPIGDWQVDRVTDMQGMFWDAGAFNQPIGKWKVDKVTEMAKLFKDATAFNHPIGEWKVDQVVDMGEMFDGATAYLHSKPAATSVAPAFTVSGARAALSVGDRVALRPGADQRGCLRDGRVGTLVKDDGSEIPYECEYNGDTHWYPAADVVAAGSGAAGASTNDDGATVSDAVTSSPKKAQACAIM